VRPFAIGLIVFLTGPLWMIGGEPEPRLKVRQDPLTGQFLITDQNRPVLQYNYFTVEIDRAAWQKVTPENQKYACARSNYIHPLFGMEGEELTRDWPVDHPHHRGIYWAWPEVGFANELGDLHALQKIFARPTGKFETRDGNEAAEIRAENHWLWLDRQPIVHERAIIRALPIGTEARVVDLRFEIKALVEGVTVARRGTDKYGGLNARFASIEQQAISVHTDAATSRPRRSWAQLSGVFPGGKTATALAIFQKTSNPDYPGDWVPFPELNWLQPAFPAAGTRYKLMTHAPLVLEFRIWIRRGVPFAHPECVEHWEKYNELNRNQ
jgi:hypothetical protein